MSLRGKTDTETYRRAQKMHQVTHLLSPLLPAIRNSSATQQNELLKCYLPLDIFTCVFYNVFDFLICGIIFCFLTFWCP